VILIESYEPTGPMGAKSVGEIGINAPISNALYDPVHPGESAHCVVKLLNGFSLFRVGREPMFI